MNLYSLEDAGKRLGVSARTVQRYIANGELRAVDIAASGSRARLRVREDDLNAWIDKRTARIKSA